MKNTIALLVDHLKDTLVALRTHRPNNAFAIEDCVWELTDAPTNKNVLAYSSSIGWRRAYFFDGQWRTSEAMLTMDDVTHWRELPPNPNEENKRCS